ncbi:MULTISPECIES: sulfurtransferase TusA family protein [unclassified Fusibacter]|uniref:sulfurtransferase TusA family protein n=1 Tax=unclassified Fusibacter TaxID=2624464 RepID=UPI001012B886|nr:MULTISPECIES: sulfurtransferase TusA family protein [unclassified Fusibacter]MCK8058181.1 sulfurtransferase TusA family protein [Fusibacter sp. A2]NPE20764.1 sulfurtransferase TusA family protein [Fusibacter sp. A1]RXV62971.1 sulfurtransferase TusA family protein [Fusibacter sp. A1]
MIIIDCFGEICPIPLLKIKKHFATMAVGDQLLAKTDHICVVEAVEEFLDTTSATCQIDEPMLGVWEILIVR